MAGAPSCAGGRGLLILVLSFNSAPVSGTGALRERAPRGIDVQRAASLARIREELNHMLPRTRRTDRRRAVRAALAQPCADHRTARHGQVDAGRRAMHADRGRQLFPVAADPLQHARGNLRRGQPARPGTRRLPARDRAQAARGAHRLPRRNLQGQLVDPERAADPHQRAHLSQRPRARRACR